MVILPVPNLVRTNRCVLSSGRQKFSDFLAGPTFLVSHLRSLLRGLSKVYTGCVEHFPRNLIKGPDKARRWRVHDGRRDGCILDPWNNFLTSWRQKLTAGICRETKKQILFEILEYFTYPCSCRNEWNTAKTL